jgi:hypothetical protein
VDGLNYAILPKRDSIMHPGLYLLGVYLTGAAIGAATTAFLAGRSDNTDKREEREDDIVSARLGVSFLWPLVLVAAIAYSPFYGIYKLGQWYGKRM